MRNAPFNFLSDHRLVDIFGLCHDSLLSINTCTPPVARPDFSSLPSLRSLGVFLLICVRCLFQFIFLNFVCCRFFVFHCFYQLFSFPLFFFIFLFFWPLFSTTKRVQHKTMFWAVFRSPVFLFFSNVFVFSLS